MRIRHFLLFCLVPVAVFLCGCDGTVGTKLGYREENFRAELRGSLNGIAVTAILEQTYSADGARIITLTYGSPAALEGIVVTYQNGETALSHGDLHPALAENAIGDLSEPIALLLLREFAVASVQKAGEESVLGLNGACEIVLDQNGVPVRFSSPVCEMFTVWWDSGADPLH